MHWMKLLIKFNKLMELRQDFKTHINKLYNRINTKLSKQRQIRKAKLENLKRSKMPLKFKQQIIE